MKIHATPIDCLVDEPVTIRLSGLPPARTVTVRAGVIDDFRHRWESHAEFVTDSAGSIALAERAPRSGTYEGGDPMGLFWSMELEPSVSERHRFTKAGADPDRVRLVAELDGHEVASTELIRRYLLPTLVGVDVRHAGLVGTLFHRPGERRPALISLTGSGGGEAKEHAALLASHGFTCLSLAYFNAAGLPPGLWEIPLEYFQTAIAWLSEQDSVLPGAIGVTGISKGGELSLLLGATFPEIRAVVARVPSSVVWTGIGPGHRRGERSSWSFQGQPLPFVAGNDERIDWTTKPVRVGEFYRAGMEDAAAMDRAAIAVEKINGPIMLLSGTDDALWPSTPFSELVVARLERKGFPHHVEHLRYEGAGHGIYHPHVPSTAIETVHPVTHVWITIGGTPRLNAYACTDSWPRVLAFLHDALG